MTPRTEHRLAADPRAKKKLQQLGHRIKRWRKKALLTLEERESITDPIRREQLAANGLSRRMLAARVGCHQQQIANVENAVNGPSWGLLYAISREMGVELLAGFPAK